LAKEAPEAVRAFAFVPKSVGLSFLIILALSCSAIETKRDVKRCFIADIPKHESNQKLLKELLEQEFAAVTSPPDQAADLMTRISEIADTLLKRGFSADAYAVPAIDENSIVSFNCFALWEGEQNGRETPPLTFFAYVWPSEEFALQYRSDPLNSYYSSIIHSHPITCAFTVLQGTLIQKNYEQVACRLSNRVVRLTGEATFHKLEASVDDLKNPFIHQLYGRGTGSTPAISLHVYGLPSEEQVMKSFKEMHHLHSYNHVLQKDGTVAVMP
jgi:hypothetical protein